MTIKFNLFTLLMGALYLIAAEPILAADTQRLPLSLTVIGNIANAPEWRSDANATITSVEFSFADNVAGSPDRAIDSSSMQLKLFNAPSYPANVAVKLPTNCKIGTAAVKDEHVVILYNGAPQTGTTLQILDQTLQTFGIRFAQAGQYGAAAGVVSCDAGSLVYEY